MDIYVDLDGITALFARAESEGRDFLFEYEVYDLISLLGGETPLKYYLLSKGVRVDEEKLSTIPGDKLVLKVVSPYILHKSDVGGVKVVEKTQGAVLSAVRGMMYEVPEKYAAMIERDRDHAPERYRGLHGDDLLKAISDDIRGVLFCQFLPMDSGDFGNELLVSLRKTREFGMVLTAGLGGTDTELYAARFSKGQAVVSASTEMVSGTQFFELYRQTLSFEKLTGRTRGGKRMVTDEQLTECFSALGAVANYFSPVNPDAPYVIEELEVNPFAFSDYLMVPLDGLCKFSKPGKLPVPRPIEKIDRLLHPESIGIIGVSAKSSNIGRIILKNILANGYDPGKLSVIHPKESRIEGVAAVSSLEAIGKKLDLLVLAVGADMVSDIVDDVIENDRAESVILIPGGLGEKEGSEGRGLELQKKIADAHLGEGKGPVFVGGNSLGILSHPGRYDSLFIPEDKLPKTRGDYLRHTAFVSQSGAYMITRMSRLAFLDPAYALSIGNQLDLTASDVLAYLNTVDEVRTIGIYMEGFQDFDGLAFSREVRRSVLLGKEILFYKAGRTPEGKSATSGHTASLAGDYVVCESCVRQAGAVVAKTFTGFEGLFKLAACLHDKEISGNRLGGISNAGYESVGIADNILGEDFKLEMADFSSGTRGTLSGVLEKYRLDGLVDVKNPMDVTPMAGEEVYEKVIQAMLDDDQVDAVVAAIVPLTPAIDTLAGDAAGHGTIPAEKSFVKRMSGLAGKTKKPLVMVVDSGGLYDHMADALQEEGLPVFRSADQAVWLLGKYIKGRLARRAIVSE